MIRPATAEDVPRLVELGEMLHRMSTYRGLSYDREKVGAVLLSLIAGSGVVFVSERDGLVMGGMAGGLTEHWFSRDKLAFDYSLFIQPGARHGITAMKLIYAFCEWARLRGARQVRLGITTGLNIDSTSRLYRACGFEDAGKLFVKEFDHGS